MALRLEEAARPTPADFEAFYAEFAPRVRALIRRRVRSRQRVDDLVQETFIRAYKNAASFDASKQAWPWLATIASNLVIDHARRRSNTHEQPAELHLLDRLDPESDPGGHYKRTEQRAAIAEALRALPTRQRRALVLHEVEEMRYEAVAVEEGLSVDAVKGLIKRARGGFREAYTALADQRGLWAIALLPIHYIRIASARLRAYASDKAQGIAGRFGSSLSGWVELAAAPLTAAAVGVALSGAIGLGDSDVGRGVAPPTSAIEKQIGTARDADALTANVRASGAAPVAPRGPLAGSGLGLDQRESGFTNTLDAEGENLEYSNHLTINAPLGPHHFWVTLVTQCHTNVVHEVMCAAGRMVPRETTIGEPQPTPEPAPPPPAPDTPLP